MKKTHVQKFIVLFLLYLFVFGHSLQANAQIDNEKQITMEFKNEGLPSIFNRLEKVSNYQVLFNLEDVSSYTSTGKVVNASINDALKAIIAKHPLDYKIDGKRINITTKDSPNVIKEIKGNLLCENDGLPIISATILIDGTNIATITDIDGNFELKNVPKDSKIMVSYVGMKTRWFTPSAKMSISLADDTQALDEVVVTGIFQRKKAGFTGSSVTVKGDDLKKYNTTNVSKALAAVAPGFRIMDDVMNGSNPNSIPDMRMRGQANMPSGTSSADVLALQGEYQTYPNQPLIIMDGFEITAQAMVDLDPDRVESITLLKDAAATAIYGSRAANGVVVIESRTPKAGKLWVTYGGEVRIETPDLTGYNLMNAAEKLEAERLSGLFSHGGEKQEMLDIYQARLREVKRGVDTYWLDKPLRTAMQQRHTVTLEGGTSDLRYRMYVGYNHTPGVMRESSRDVLTGSFDLQYRFKKLLFKNSITIDDTNSKESPWGSFSNYASLNPYLRPYGPDGEINKMIDNSMGINPEGSRVANPMYNTIFNSKNGSNNFSFRELFKIQYNVNEELRLEGNFSLSKSVGNRGIFRTAQHTAFDDVVDPSLRGDYRRTQSEAVNWEAGLTASYNKLFNDTHYITANGRMSVLENSTNSYGAYLTGFPNENMDDILFGQKYDEKMTGLEQTSRSIGWVGAVGYSYKYKYSADFNIRLDGSSQFGTDNRWAPFWSTGLRWDAKKEEFLKDVDFLSDLVLRGSLGITGSQGFNPYQAHEYYTYSNLLKPYVSSGGTGTEILAMPNENLKWQETQTLNFGVEAGFLNKRITARLDMYRKITDNLLTEVSLAPSLGFVSYPENLGKLENKGVELSLSFIPYQNAQKQSYWTVTVNGSHNVDKLLRISEAMKHMNEINASNLEDSPLPRYEEGQSMNRIWVVPSLGIDPATGWEIFQKRNGNMASTWNAVDIMPIGNTEPTWQGYINSSFTYKGFGADVSFSYRFGGQVYNQTLIDKVENLNINQNGDARVLTMRWLNPGDRVAYKQLSSVSENTKASSRFIMDENLFQMSALSFYYRMDNTNTRSIEKLGLSSAKVALNMQDLFYLSSVKRERGLNYPYSRQFTVSLNLAF